LKEWDKGGKLVVTLKFEQKVWIGPYNLQFPTFQFLWFFKNSIFVQNFIFLVFLVHSLRDNRDSDRILTEGGKSFGWHVFLSRERSNLVSTSFIWWERCSPRCSFFLSITWNDRFDLDKYFKIELILGFWIDFRVI